MILKRIRGKATAVEVGATLISRVTDAGMEDRREGRNRPPEPLYRIVCRDALVIRRRHEGRGDNRAVFVAVGVTEEGSQAVSGWGTSAGAR